jgi:hypothetical protein
MKMSHALFGIETRRDPARERLAPLLSDARARQRRARTLALRLPLLRRSHNDREGGA